MSSISLRDVFRMTQHKWTANKRQNQAMHAKDGVAFLQMENQTAVLGDGNRYHAHATW